MKICPLASRFHRVLSLEISEIALRQLVPKTVADKSRHGITLWIMSSCEIDLVPHLVQQLSPAINNNGIHVPKRVQKTTVIDYRPELERMGENWKTSQSWMRSNHEKIVRDACDCGKSSPIAMRHFIFPSQLRNVHRVPSWHPWWILLPVARRGPQHWFPLRACL